jgi:hypothetical protein
MRVVLPGTSHVLQLFPAAIRLFGCQHREYELIKELCFPELKLLTGWTVFVDLMRHYVLVEGKAAQGFFRFRIDASSRGIIFRSLKGPVQVSIQGHVVDLQRGEEFFFSDSRDRPWMK